MISMQRTLPHPTLEQLDFRRLQRLLGSLGLQAGYWAGGDEPVQGFAPEAPICQRLCAGGRHCQPFLLQLARDAQADASLACRSCLNGASTVAVRLDEQDPKSPVVLACFVTAALADSRAARRQLLALGTDVSDLLAPLRQQVRYRPDDAAWLQTTVARIAREWYARGCDQAHEVEALSQSLADTYEELSFIYRLNEAMNVTASPRAYFQEMAEELLDLLAAQAIVISLAEALPDAQGRTARISAGQLPVTAERLLAQVDAEKVSQRGYQLAHLDAEGNPAADPQAAALRMLCTPIIRGGRRLGVIATLRTAAQGKFDNIDVTRVSSITKSAAMVLENFRLYDNLRQLFLGTVRALTRSIDAKDPYTCGHSERVASLARRLLLRMGGSPEQAERLYLCGLLHDIGKIGVPEDVLRKPGRLTEQEFAHIQRHPAVGTAILDGISELEDIVPGVLHHHERVDGRGYPGRLAGQDVPLYARILAVADTFDAMTSSRPYRTALSVEIAVDEIKRHAGTQFDPAVVEAFLQLDPQATFEELSRIQGMGHIAPALEGAGAGREPA